MKRKSKSERKRWSEEFLKGLDDVKDPLDRDPLADLASLGEKRDDGKARWDLMPWRALDQVAQVMTYGAEKYGDHNWKTVTRLKDRYFAAAMRHLVEHRFGREIDPESGEYALAHAICSLLFVLEEIREEAYEGVSEDDEE